MKNLISKFIIFVFLSLNGSEKEFFNNSKKLLHAKIFSGCNRSFGSLYFAKLALIFDTHLNSPLVGNSILHYAAQHNECELFEFLILFKKEAISPLINQQNKPNQQTALHYTIGHNNYQRTKALLNLKANTTIKNIYGITPLDLSKTISQSIYTLVHSYTKIN